MFSFFRPKPQDFRSLVFQAVAGPRPAAVTLCRERQGEIWKEWPAWAQQLMMLQGRPAEAKSYADSLRAVAEICGEFAEAEKFVKMAWQMCLEMRDLEGMENHREGLFELSRYTDRREEAFLTPWFASHRRSN